MKYLNKLLVPFIIVFLIAPFLLRICEHIYGDLKDFSNWLREELQ